MSNYSNKACQMTLQQCIETLDNMSLQMEIIRANLSNARNNNAEKVGCAADNKGLAKIVAAKQNVDGSLTKMFALKKETPPTDMEKMYGRYGSQEDCATAQPPDENDPIAELEEMLDCQDQQSKTRTFALFSSVSEAEEFLMNAINQVVSMFSTISRILKDDALSCLKKPPTDKAAVDLITEQCLALLLDLQIAMIQPISKLKELLVTRLKVIVPELDLAFKNMLMFQKLELLSARTIARQEARRQVHLESLNSNPPAAAQEPQPGS